MINWRSFLHAAATAGGAQLLPFTARATPPSDTPDIAAIGCGMMGAANLRSAAQAGANVRNQPVANQCLHTAYREGWSLA